ncbi:MAG TPA: sulfotransferase [bacterium]|nr:sulfotransferase [bacterium]
MSETRENRFLERSPRTRIAVFTSSRFPAGHDQHILARIIDLCRQVDADVRFFHHGIPETLLEGDGEHVHELLARSMIAPTNANAARADIDHFERTMPEQTRQLLTDIRNEFEEPADPREHHATRWAFSLARLAAAWAPDLLLSYSHYEGSTAASIAHRLLGIPRVLVLPRPPEDGATPLLWQWHLAETELLILGAPARAAGIADLARRRAPAGSTVDLDAPDLFDRVAALAAAGRQRRTNELPTFVSTPREPLRDLPAKPFLVLGTERTGSNMLVNMLNSHAAIQSYGELFNPTLMQRGVIDGLDAATADADADDLRKLRAEDPRAFHIELIRRAAQGGKSHVGFKLLYYHGVIDNRLIDHLVAVPDLRVIHLTRRDRLARWVSHVRAVESGSWYATRSDRQTRPQGPRQVELALHTTLQDFLWQQLQEERAAATFAHLPVLEMSYEELAAAPAEQSGRALDFLEVERRPLQTSSRKTGARDARDLVSNWDEIAAGLRRTPFRHLAERARV